MSRTMRKNGSKIEMALRSAKENCEMRWFCFTVGEAAKLADVSKPTAQKYLNILAEAKIIEPMMTAAAPQQVYCWCEGFYTQQPEAN